MLLCEVRQPMPTALLIAAVAIAAAITAATPAASLFHRRRCNARRRRVDQSRRHRLRNFRPAIFFNRAGSRVGNIWPGRPAGHRRHQFFGRDYPASGIGKNYFESLRLEKETRCTPSNRWLAQRW